MKDFLATEGIDLVPASGVAVAVLKDAVRKGAIGKNDAVLLNITGGGEARLSADPREGAQTMTAFVAATGQGDIPTGSIEYKTIFAVGITLFVMTLIMNMIAIRLVRRFREVYE